MAVLRTGALGDFIVTLPALQAIRTAYPNAEIVLLGTPWQKAFLTKHRTPVDRVVVVPVTHRIREEANQVEDEEETAAFFPAMQQEAFDLALNFQGDGVYSNPFIKRLQAKFTVGLAKPPAMHTDRYVNYFYYQSELLRFVEVAEQIGAICAPLEPVINVLQEDRQEIQPLLDVLSGREFIVINPCARDLRRMWPLENYPRLADELKTKGFDIIFSGSKEDRPVVQQIIEQMKLPAINTCGDFSLGGLAALLSAATLVIGPDTGPLHLARAVNTPTVGMYWAPNLINWGPLTRNIHFPLVSWNLVCPFCGIIPNDPYPFEPRSHCDHAISFVRDITVDNVITATENILSNKGAAYKMSVAH